jgi:hypothetical protein
VQGRFEEALTLAGEEHSRALRHGAPKLRLRALMAQGRALLAQESHAKAADSFAEARRLSESIEYRSGLWRSLGWEATVRERLGEQEAAERLRRQARAVLEGALTQVKEADLQGALRREALALRLAG